MGHAACLSIASVADRCLRALSPYDCRRHYAQLAGRGGQCEDEGPDLFSKLRPDQRQAIERGVAAAKAVCDALRLAAEPAELDHARGGFAPKALLAERGPEFRREIWRRQQRRARALRGRSAERIGADESA